MFTTQKEPSNEYVPSMLGHTRVVTEQQQGCKNTTLNKQNARASIKCINCSKPRVIYCEKKLNDREKRQLRRLLTDVGNIYECGCVLVPEDSYFDKSDTKLFTRLQMHCGSSVEVPYYTSKYINQSKDVCYYCGQNGVPIEEEVRGQYTTPMPRCNECKTAGKPPPHTGRKRQAR